VHRLRGVMARRCVTLLVGMALVVGACGGGGLSAEEQAIVGEIALAHSYGEPLDLPQRSTGECIGEEMVRAAGLDRLHTAGFGNGAISDPEAAQAAFSQLINDPALSPEDLQALYLKCFNPVEDIAHAFIKAGVPAESAVCAAQMLLDGYPERSLTLFGYMNLVAIEVAMEDDVYLILEGSYGAEAREALAECLSPEALAELMADS